jgi:adenylate kinase family enzyme/predicted N-acetyltransferase YhbS
MLKIYNLKEKQEYIEEVATLTEKEWGQKNLSKKDFEKKVKNKILKIKLNFDNFNYCKLILLDNQSLIGFISIFPNDGDERKELSPWYATMYVKKEYRGNGYSKILNDAILSEARKRNIAKLYLKTDLENYYEKFGAKYVEMLNNGEKLYYFDILTNRISIIGGSGSGKSTLADILSKELNIPAIHLDAINYNANWVEINKNERDTIISSKSNDEKWIIDGNYNKTLKERLEKADLIIWLDYSSFAHIKGVFKRIIKNYNKEKPEIPGCKERINFIFLKYVVTYNHRKRPQVMELLKNVPNDKLLIFRKQKDLNKWLKAFTHNENILDSVNKK